MTVSAVLTLLGVSNIDWPVCLKHLKDPKFLDQLKSYDKDNISEAIIAKVEADYTSKENFTFAFICKKSSAAANLANWVINLVRYHKILKVVKPMMQRVNKIEPN